MRAFSNSPCNSESENTMSVHSKVILKYKKIKIKIYTHTHTHIYKIQEWLQIFLLACVNLKSEIYAIKMVLICVCVRGRTQTQKLYFPRTVV